MKLSRPQNPTKIGAKLNHEGCSKKVTEKTLFSKGAQPSKLCSRFSGAHIFMFSDSSKKLEKTRPQGSSKPPKNDPKPLQQAVKKRSEKRCHKISEYMPPKPPTWTQKALGNQRKIVLGPSWMPSPQDLSATGSRQPKMTEKLHLNDLQNPSKITKK